MSDPKRLGQQDEFAALFAAERRSLAEHDLDDIENRLCLAIFPPPVLPAPQPGGGSESLTSGSPAALPATVPTGSTAAATSCSTAATGSAAAAASTATGLTAIAAAKVVGAALVGAILFGAVLFGGRVGTFLAEDDTQHSAAQPPVDLPVVEDAGLSVERDADVSTEVGLDAARAAADGGAGPFGQAWRAPSPARGDESQYDVEDADAGTTDAAAAARPVSILPQELADFDRGREAYRRGDRESAIAHLQRYLRQYPEGRLRLEAAALLFEAAVGVWRPQVVAAAAEELLRDRGQVARAKVWRDYGRALSALGECAAARQALRRSLELREELATRDLLLRTTTECAERSAPLADEDAGRRANGDDSSTP